MLGRPLRVWPVADFPRTGSTQTHSLTKQRRVSGHKSPKNSLLIGCSRGPGRERSCGGSKGRWDGSLSRHLRGRPAARSTCKWAWCQSPVTRHRAKQALSPPIIHRRALFLLVFFSQIVLRPVNLCFFLFYLPPDGCSYHGNEGFLNRQWACVNTLYANSTPARCDREIVVSVRSGHLGTFTPSKSFRRTIYLFSGPNDKKTCCQNCDFFICLYFENKLPKLHTIYACDMEWSFGYVLIPSEINTSNGLNWEVQLMRCIC